jgi:hypothetical protein
LSFIEKGIGCIREADEALGAALGIFVVHLVSRWTIFVSQKWIPIELSMNFDRNFLNLSLSSLSISMGLEELIGALAKLGLN